MKKMKTIGKTAAMASLATMVLASCASANKAQKPADNMQATKMSYNKFFYKILLKSSE